MTTGITQLAAALAITLICAYVPGYAAVRLLNGSRLLGLALAPPISAALAALCAIAAQIAGVQWSLIPFSLGTALLLVTCFCVRKAGHGFPQTFATYSPHAAPRSSISRAVVIGAIGVAAAIAIGPIAFAARRPDAILERYDTLFHLVALHHIKTTGQASTLTLNSVANTTGSATAYPAAFHDLASLVPGIDTPILLNGATLALAIIPWVSGLAVLAKALFPSSQDAPFVAALAALLIPASPLNLWIHLSPIPNLVGFAMLPGTLAAGWALWTSPSLRAFWRSHRHGGASETTSGAPGEDDGAKRTDAAIALAAMALAGVGLTLLQPNVAVTALLLLAVMTATTTISQWRTRPHLAAIPAVFLAPVGLLSFTPLGARVTGFTGGLQVPWWQALGEISLGLWTVWPMALGTVFALIWWPGLIRNLRDKQLRWLGISWIVFAVIYFDAAIDSPLGLSVLYFRGQDRVAIPLAMLSTALMVPGITAWKSALGRTGLIEKASIHRHVPVALTLVFLLTSATSLPSRFDNASLNLAPQHGLRGRFIQADEREAFAAVKPRLDPTLSVLASPYSGAAHMSVLYDIPVYFPVAGVALRAPDKNAIEAVGMAGQSPAHCRTLRDLGIGYVYQERRLYQRDPAFEPIQHGADDLGEALFTTEHSRLIKVDCATQ